MHKYRKRVIALTIGVAFLLPIVYGYLKYKNFAVLNPAGLVASEERQLIFITLFLSLLVVLPVYILTFTIAWRYREGNKRAKYSPGLSGNVWAELLWWSVPLAIITVLSVITWRSSHALDPRQPIKSAGPVLKVQVIAMQWRWLFIYPDEKVASLNRLELPVGRAVEFDVTADAPMNAFWIPQLGSQIYAMPGMSTKLNLIANRPGIFMGSSANLSGKGFAKMRFNTVAVSQLDFQKWLDAAKRSSPLDWSTYQRLAKPSTSKQTNTYVLDDKELFHSVMMKYTGPGGQHAR
jgi:cytochrome o ubiquinol oxidase subunit 2